MSRIFKSHLNIPGYAILVKEAVPCLCYDMGMKLTFRPLTKPDYSLFAHWLAEPHVARWWREPATVEHVEKEYGPSDEKTAVYVVEGNGQPIGIIQSYPVEDYPEHGESVKMPGGVGVDLFIGEPSLIGKGYGAQLLSDFVSQVVRPKYPDATGVVGDPEVENLASVRAFEKAGFVKGRIVPGEYGPEQLMVLRFRP
jgi:aminoglycoside 6'-N-acetyltransferase